MQWPSRTEVWGDRLPQTYAAYAQVARAIAAFEPVSMVCRPEGRGAGSPRLRAWHRNGAAPHRRQLVQGLRPHFSY
ncbi:agmatine deiminase family protein [Parvibaculum sp.]|uniref:agmatine deiminase family protein n=1 Tax=Parvibaculum sp. TaxID=2024848 RepID=UPI003BAB7ABB